MNWKKRKRRKKRRKKIVISDGRRVSGPLRSGAGKGHWLSSEIVNNSSSNRKSM